MPGVWFWQCFFWAALSLPWTVIGQHLGAGGLPGQRTPRTGAVWPPYEGAGQGYWARQAGLSLSFQQQQEQTYQPEQIQNTLQKQQQEQQQFYAPQMVSGQTYWVPRQQQQQIYTEQLQQQQMYAQQLQQQQIYAQHLQQLQQQQIYGQQQQQLPYTQAVDLTTDQLRAQQKALMQKYLSSVGNEVLTSTVHPKILVGGGQNLYRFSTVDGSLTQVELQALALP